ncbi:uncharacterized protein LOC142173405 [Nicotiana tabacum]|uniref:Uncharacterized protein LOC142173405 n=1 Tax=Nicotiana tabacum TaxID=4097 RepID=A0AC58TCZ0_TOBAC
MVLGVQRQLNMEHAIIVDPIGLSGGLCLFWNNDVQVVWKLSPIENTLDFVAWWYDVFINANKYPESIEIVKLSISIMWQIWKVRNLLNFNGDICEPNEIVNKALFDFHEYKKSMFTIFSPPHMSDCSDNKNITVAQDGVIMFADVGLQLEKKMVSIGVAAMDRCGHLLQAFSTPIQFVRKAITAEALAIREALKKAIENGWSKVHILSDAKNVVDMIRKMIVVSWEIDSKYLEDDEFL